MNDSILQPNDIVPDRAPPVASGMPSPVGGLNALPRAMNQSDLDQLKANQLGMLRSPQERQDISGRQRSALEILQQAYQQPISSISPLEANLLTFANTNPGQLGAAASEGQMAGAQQEDYLTRMKRQAGIDSAQAGLSQENLFRNQDITQEDAAAKNLVGLESAQMMRLAQMGLKLSISEEQRYTQLVKTFYTQAIEHGVTDTAAAAADASQKAAEIIKQERGLAGGSSLAASSPTATLDLGGTPDQKNLDRQKIIETLKNNRDMAAQQGDFTRAQSIQKDLDAIQAQTTDSPTSALTPGGGLAVASPGNIAGQKDQALAGTKLQETIDAEAKAGRSVQAQLGEIKNDLADFSPSKAAAYARAISQWKIASDSEFGTHLSTPDDVKLAGSTESVDKISFQLATQALKAINQSRGTQMEFFKSMENNPNIQMTPAGMAKLIDYMNYAASNGIDQQKSFYDWKKDKTPDQYQNFNPVWQETLAKRNMVRYGPESREVTVGGQTYTARKGPDGSYYVKMPNGSYAMVKD